MALIINNMANMARLEMTMTILTISEARNSFSAIVADLESGRESEYVIRDRDVPVARIVPYAAPKGVSKRYGLLREKPLVLDDDVFDALDAEVADLFGVGV